MMNKKQLWKAVLLASLVVATPRPASASAMSQWANPFDSVEQIRIELKYGFSRETRLFEIEEQERFFTTLKQEIRARLASAGIGVSDDSHDFLSIRIWGHKKALRDGKEVSVFMLSIWAMDSDHLPEELCDEDRHLDSEDTVVGLAEEGDLKSTLHREIFEHLDAVLPTPKK